MVFGELYRRGTEWKFRAVGQGYASGPAGTASDYGVNVRPDRSGSGDGMPHAGRAIMSP